MLIQNRQGKTRLSKWYSPFADQEKFKLLSEVHRLLQTRERQMTNFIEWRNYKLVYRRYAGLYFIMCIDVTDNELSYLEAIHLFVEVLDKYFGNVCELDLIFDFHKVYMVLDEVVLAGEVMETSKPTIEERLARFDKMD